MREGANPESQGKIRSEARRYEAATNLLKVLEMLWDAEPEPVTPTHVISKLGFGRNTAIRMLSALVRNGWATVDGPYYRATERGRRGDKEAGG